MPAKIQENQIHCDEDSFPILAIYRCIAIGIPGRRTVNARL